MSNRINEWLKISIKNLFWNKIEYIWYEYVKKKQNYEENLFYINLIFNH